MDFETLIDELKQEANYNLLLGDDLPFVEKQGLGVTFKTMQDVWQWYLSLEHTPVVLYKDVYVSFLFLMRIGYATDDFSGRPYNIARLFNDIEAFIPTKIGEIVIPDTSNENGETLLGVFVVKSELSDYQNQYRQRIYSDFVRGGRYSPYEK